MRIFSKANASWVSIYVDRKDKNEKLWTSIERKRILIYTRRIEADCHLSPDVHLALLFCYQIGKIDEHCHSLECCVAIDTGPVLKLPSFHTLPSQKECWVSSNKFMFEKKKKSIHRRETKLESGWVSSLPKSPPSDSFLS